MISFAQPNQSVSYNDTSTPVQLVCTVKANISGLLFDWEWTGPAVDNDRTMYSRNMSDISTLTINNPSYDDSGLYSCIATYAAPDDERYVCNTDKVIQVKTNLTGTNHLQLSLEGNKYERNSSN